jgi:hypothetical protein
MKQTIASRIIIEKNAIQFLSNPNNSRYLECFMVENTVGFAAAGLNEPLHRVFRQVQKMLKLGLVEQTRLETRTGRAIRYYRTVSQEFFVPFSHKSFEEVLLEINLPLEREFIAAIASEWTRYAANNQGWGTLYSRGNGGRLTARAPVHSNPKEPLPQAPKVFSWFQEWNLSPEDSDALLTDLSALVKRYNAKNDGSQAPFLVRVGMSPVSR